MSIEDRLKKLEQRVTIMQSNFKHMEEVIFEELDEIDEWITEFCNVNKLAVGLPIRSSVIVPEWPRPAKEIKEDD